MIFYISDLQKSFFDLIKADQPTLPGKPTTMPTTPGAVSGGGKQVIDCPLGAKCPDGGKHQFGSQKLQQHTTQATQVSKPDEPVDVTESTGVEPGSTNIGGLGSDKAPRPSAKTRGALNPGTNVVRSPRENVKEGQVARQAGTSETKPGVKADKTFANVHKEQAGKATKQLDDAKKIHEQTKAKVDKIKQSNEAKTKAHGIVTKMAQQAKAKGKPVKLPKKPKLEKEPKIADKPELNEPGSDGEMLRHENHSSKAKELADRAESHLKSNKDLNPEQKRRLERAHKIAAFHANIPYTPTATHKQELGEAERAMHSLGVKEHHDVVEAENAENQKDQAIQNPVTDLDHARVVDHAGQAKALKEKILSHVHGNPNISPEEKQKANHILNELDKHENLQQMPSTDHSGELKELNKLAGDMGKKPYDPSKEETKASGAPGVVGRPPTNAGYLMQQIRTGQSVGSGLAATATSPYGGAGHIAGQTVGYGVQGATAAGHKLLQHTRRSDDQKQLDQQKEEQARDQE